MCEPEPAAWLVITPHGYETPYTYRADAEEHIKRVKAQYGIDGRLEPLYRQYQVET